MNWWALPAILACGLAFALAAAAIILDRHDRHIARMCARWASDWELPATPKLTVVSTDPSEMQA